MAILWGHSPDILLIGWLAVAVVVTAAGLMLTRQYHKTARSIANTGSWAHRFYFEPFVAGCVWGFCSTTLMPINNPAKLFAVAFMISGLAAGGLSCLAPARPAFPLFMLPLVLPMSAWRH